jgi:hypothetical protein
VWSAVVTRDRLDIRLAGGYPALIAEFPWYDLAGIHSSGMEDGLGWKGHSCLCPVSSPLYAAPKSIGTPFDERRKLMMRVLAGLPNRFQQDEIVRQALSRGVELKGYSAQIESELKEVRGPGGGTTVIIAIIIIIIIIIIINIIVVVFVVVVVFANIRIHTLRVVLVIVVPGVMCPSVSSSSMIIITWLQLPHPSLSLIQQVEMESVKEYVQQSSNVVSLHSQIQACDMILARMQEMLLGFQVGITDHKRRRRRMVVVGVWRR